MKRIRESQRRTTIPARDSKFARYWLVVPAVVAAVLAMLVLWSADRDDRGASSTQAGPVHVHGLGVDPVDGALFIAAHTGLFRVAEGESKAKRVGDRYQDTMGFTVVGPHRFLGSGHPDLRDDLPPLLGLIASSNAGASWEPISLLGEADFHVLRFSGGRIYGYDSSNDRVLTSADRGRSWHELAKPGPLVDLAIDPAKPDHIVVSTLGGAQDASSNRETVARTGRSSARQSACSHGRPLMVSISSPATAGSLRAGMPVAPSIAGDRSTASRQRCSPTVRTSSSLRSTTGRSSTRPMVARHGACGRSPRLDTTACDERMPSGVVRS